VAALLDGGRVVAGERDSTCCGVATFRQQWLEIVAKAGGERLERGSRGRPLRRRGRAI
jgi:hypothetical protein